jgi:hypothetical protein
MGIVNFFKSFSNPDVMYEETVNSQRKTYNKVKNYFIYNKTKYDNHMILSSVWAARQKCHYNDIDDRTLNEGGLVATIYISLLEEEESIEVMGALFFIEESLNFKETPTYKKAEQIYTNKMLKLVNIIEDEVKFEEYYKKRNPATYSIMMDQASSFSSFINFIRNYTKGF